MKLWWYRTFGRKITCWDTRRSPTPCMGTMYLIEKTSFPFNPRKLGVFQCDSCKYKVISGLKENR